MSKINCDEHIFIVGPTKSGKTSIGNLIAKKFNMHIIHASDWLKDGQMVPKFIPSKNDLSDQNRLEEMTLYSQSILQINPDICINHIKYVDNLDNSRDEKRSITASIVEGLRNPRDFLTLFNPSKDNVVLLTLKNATLYPLPFENKGLEIIEDSVNWMIKCGMLSSSRVNKIVLHNFDEINFIAESIINWIGEDHVCPR